MARRQQQVVQLPSPSDEGKAVRGQRAQASPDLVEIQLFQTGQMGSGGPQDGPDPRQIHRKVQAGQFQGSTETQPVPHGSGGHLGIGQHQRNSRGVCGSLDGHAVSLGGLDGDVQRHGSSDPGRPGSGGKHHLFGPEIPSGRHHPRDPSPGGLHLQHFRPGPQDRARAAGACRHLVDESVRDQMSVVRKMDSGDDRRTHIRLHLPDSMRVQQSGFETEFSQEPSFCQGFGQKRLGSKDLQPALLPETELQFALIGQIPIQIQAGLREIPQNGNALSHGLHPGSLLKPPEPAHQVEIETGLDVEGAHRVEQPSKALAEHSRRGQRDRVAGDDQPRVPV